MSKFQVGDVVRCMSGNDRFKARVTDVFTHLGNLLLLDGYEGTWSPDHFILVTRPNEAVNRHVRVYSGGQSFQVPAAEAEALPPALGDATNPSHYKQGGLEAIDVIEAFGLNFRLANVCKYILRAGRKGDRQEDLKKALWYLQREIDQND